MNKITNLISEINMRKRTDLKCMFVDVDPLLASKLLLLNTNNRKISLAMVGKYKNEILKDEWCPCASGIGISEKGVLVDGQHRLQAIVDANKKAVLLIAYDLPDISIQKVDRHKTRSVYDVLTISGFAEKSTQGKKCVLLASTLCKVPSNFQTNKLVSDSEVRDYLQENYNKLKDVVDMCTTGDRGTSASGYMAGIYRYCEMDKEKAKEFAHQVKTGSMLSGDHPALRLRKALLGETGHNFFTLHGASKGRTPIQCRMYRTTIYCAKAHYEGREITRLNEIEKF